MRTRILLFFLLFVCFFLNAVERHIGLLIKPDFRGEISFAYRIQAACKNLHWLADVIDIDDPEELKKNSYDFVISLVPGVYEHPKCKNYLAIFDPVHHYFDEKGFLKKRYRSYDGYLLSFSPGSSGIEKKDFEDDRKFPYIPWYPSAQRTEYQTVDPSHLFYICCAWGDRLENENFQQLLNLLDAAPYARLYGNPQFQPFYPHSYQGSIPYNQRRLYEVAAQAGVGLVLHSSTHNIYGLPSGRIFEMAAASTVIISDQNSFVQTHFGDSVLYINTDEDGPSIHKQIQDHMDWIQVNKTLALEKAKKAHEIYIEKFLLEDQLLRLGAFHDRLSNKPITPSWSWLQRLASLD